MSKAGRPLKFTDPIELQKKIDEYFEWADSKNRVYTVSDLAWYLDTNRQTLLDYENCCDNDKIFNSLDDKVKVIFTDTIKRAKARIEGECEQRLYKKDSVTGAIFALKNNYNWVDKQEIVQENREIKVELTD